MMRKLNYIYSVFLFAILFTTSSCDLEIQKPYEFKPEVDELVTFKTQTPLEWMQTKVSLDTAKLDANNFDLMVRAIKLCKLEDIYNNPNGTDRTFLLLTNSAFTAAAGANAGINVALLGTATARIENANVPRLTNLLKYHVVNKYIDQVPTLEKFDTDYLFQTEVAGVDGEIYFRRDNRLAINVNAAAALPATRKTALVFRHNYIFKNGIAHIMNNYVRKIAF
jgi:uncharacterized surface protein with fasciclin (FAS1) repeats